jgi:hypothetical protein
MNVYTLLTQMRKMGMGKCSFFTTGFDNTSFMNLYKFDNASFINLYKFDFILLSNLSFLTEHINQVTHFTVLLHLYPVLIIDVVYPLRH